MIVGLHAAVATPVHGDGRIDLDTLDRIIDFLVEAGVSGICLGGATGEYPHFETDERKALVARAARRLPRERLLLVGVGGSSIARTIELGQAALDAGSGGLLLPMPMFFRYAQADLEAYCVDVARALKGPCLLYNLPDFTNGIQPETAIRLLQHEAHIVGIKDSSGETSNLSVFAAARQGESWSLLVGDDRRLRSGLRAGWDGGISGVAGFCPELLVGLYRSHVEGDQDETERLQKLLDDLISRIAVFPTPWGIRIGLSARGIDTGPLPLPVTPARQRQIAEFTSWLPDWLVQNGLDRPVDDERAGRVIRSGTG